MYIIVGGTGHVGSVVANHLLELHEPLTIVTRDAAKAAGWADRGARLAEVDVHDADALRRVLREGKRAFLLNPPAPVTTDTDAEEHRTVSALLAALNGSRLEKIVAASTYGAQPGTRCGDLNVLYDFEQGLQSQPIPVAINRGAYYFSNFDLMLDQARQGAIEVMYPADFVLPMVAPEDLGRAAAQRLLSGIDDRGIRTVEGPSRYTFSDVAAAFAKALRRTVALKVLPPDAWVESFQRAGFSRAAAESYARMTQATRFGNHAYPDDSIRGEATLESYIAALVSRAGR